MATIIRHDFGNQDVNVTIDVSQVSKSARELKAGIIAPAVEDTSYEVAPDHSSDPIKSVDDIRAISEWFINNGKYRDNMLFIVGINFGLRVSDLLTLRFSHIIDDKFRFKHTFPILEKKTKNTRSVQKNRYITINDAVIDAVTLYLENTPGVKLSDYMFRSESNNGTSTNRPIHRNSVERMLKKVGDELNLSAHLATHSLRKTFGYHQMLIGGNSPRTLLLLQKIFGHSTSAQTLDYIGITSEEVSAAYIDLNLGGDCTRQHLVDSTICEDAV